LNGLRKGVRLASAKISANQFGIRRRNSTMPEVGEMAPDFELKSHLEKDKKVKLSDFRGKSNVVIAFYPLAWTPV
jgi:peroxiredoxin